MNTFAIFVCLFALIGQVFAGKHAGYATSYSGPHHINSSGQNACGYNPSSLPSKFQVYFAAMNEADWNAAGGKSRVCGKCIRARGSQGQTTRGFHIKDVVVKIVDQCPSSSCSKGSVDFSTSALKAITGFSADKKKISWEYVNCNTGKPSSGRKLMAGDEIF